MPIKPGNYFDEVYGNQPVNQVAPTETPSSSPSQSGSNYGKKSFAQTMKDETLNSALIPVTPPSPLLGSSVKSGKGISTDYGYKPFSETIKSAPVANQPLLNNVPSENLFQKTKPTPGKEPSLLGSIMDYISSRKTITPIDIMGKFSLADLLSQSGVARNLPTMKETQAALKEDIAQSENIKRYGIVEGTRRNILGQYDQDIISDDDKKLIDKNTNKLTNIAMGMVAMGGIEEFTNQFAMTTRGFSEAAKKYRIPSDDPIVNMNRELEDLNTKIKYDRSTMSSKELKQSLSKATQLQYKIAQATSAINAVEVPVKQEIVTADRILKNTSAQVEKVPVIRAGEIKSVGQSEAIKLTTAREVANKMAENTIIDRIASGEDRIQTEMDVARLRAIDPKYDILNDPEAMNALVKSNSAEEVKMTIDNKVNETSLIQEARKMQTEGRTIESFINKEIVIENNVDPNYVQGTAAASNRNVIDKMKQDIVSGKRLPIVEVKQYDLPYKGKTVYELLSSDGNHRLQAYRELGAKIPVKIKYTKSQLTDIWNKAQEETKPKLTIEQQYKSNQNRIKELDREIKDSIGFDEYMKESEKDYDALNKAFKENRELNILKKENSVLYKKLRDKYGDDYYIDSVIRNTEDKTQIQEPKTRAKAYQNTPDQELTLSQFVIKNGGINYDSATSAGMRGELDALTKKEGGGTLIIRREGGKKLSNMAEIAKEAGFNITDEADLVIKLREGIAGRETYHPGREVSDDEIIKKMETSGAFGFNPKNLESIDGEAAIKETKKIIKRSEIAKELSKKLNVPIRNGKFRKRGAVGIFKTGPELIRVKGGGLPTIFHEVGHFLDVKFKLSDMIDQSEAFELVKEYEKDFTGQPELMKQEALAEFIRYKMTGQDSGAQSMAPKFYEEYNKVMDGLPEVKDVLETAAADYKRWLEMPASAKVLSHLAIGPVKSDTSLKDKISSVAHTLYAMTADDMHPFGEFTKLATKQLGRKLTIDEDVYKAVRNLKGWIGKADTFLNKGTFGKDFWKVEDNKIKPNFKGKGLYQILKPIEDKGLMNDFRVYVVSQRIVEDFASRAEKTGEKMIVSGLKYADARDARDEMIAKHPEFEEQARELYQYQNDLLSYGEENGLIGKNTRALIDEANKFRVPFYRVMEEIRSSYMGGKKVSGNIANPVKKIRGSEREIIDPIESIVKDTYAIINAADRNNIGVMMARLAEKDPELGRVFERVDNKMTGTKVMDQEVRSAIEKKLAKETDNTIEEIAPVLDELIKGLDLTVFRPTMDRGSNMINLSLGDKKATFQVDPDLFRAMQGMNVEDMGLIMKILSFPAKTLRAGATLTPEFSMRNPLRDQLSGAVFSDNSYIPYLDFARGIFELFKKGDLYDLWKMGGGEQSMLGSLDRTRLQKTYKEMMRSNFGKIVDYAKSPIEILRIISEVTEKGTRLGEMRKAIRSMADPRSAAFSSREITLDFAKQGYVARSINMITAFFSANINGTDTFFRKAKAHPTRTLLKALLYITLPSVLLYYANRNDPRYKEIPQWRKDLFWIIIPSHITQEEWDNTPQWMKDEMLDPIRGFKYGIYMYPKPFELGILFGSVPERILEYIDTHDTELFDSLLKSVADGATPGIIPTAAIPIIENQTNYSFFLDRSIVPRGKENLPAGAQSSGTTSEISKLIGEKLNYSPAKIDNLIYGWSGGMGRYATKAIDSALKGSGMINVPEKPSEGLSGIPGIKGFVIKSPEGSGSESVNRVYNKYNEVSAGYTYVAQLISSGDTDKADKYIADHPDIIYNDMLNATIDAFSNISNARDIITMDTEMDSKEKRSRISELDKLQTQIAQSILDEIK